MSEPIYLEGPILRIEGELVLKIPLALGGGQLAPFARRIGNVEGHHLKVVIPEWLAAKLNVDEGSKVLVDNENGKFTITRSESK